MENIKAKSEQWRNVIAAELGVESESCSAFELLCNFFENSDEYDEKAYKRLKNEYKLDNTISDDEYRHSISGVLLNTFKLCKEVYKQIPDRMEKKFQYLKQAKVWSKYIGYLEHHEEKALVNVVRTLNASIIEVNVQTTELEAELLYWNMGKIFVMNFVPELDLEVDDPLSIQEL